MYIREVRIRNFKTLRSAKFRFKPGLNVITGPNGTGKSNIIEAALFGLRETNPHNLRATKFSDLVTRTRSDTSRKCYVSLELVGEDGSTLNLKRKITKGGYLSYFVDGKKVRSKDYKSALLTRGEGPVRFRYLAQGDIIKTAEMTSVERRKLIEDITGLSVFDDKKANAVKKLDDAERNLRVAVAKIDEIRGNLLSFFREFLDHQRKERLEDTLRLLKGGEISGEISQEEESLQKVEEKLENLEDERTRLEEAKSKLEEERSEIQRSIDETREEIQERGGRQLAELQEEKTERQTERQNSLWVIQKGTERIEALKRQREESYQALQQVRDELADLREDLVDLESDLDANRREIESLRERETQLLSRLEELDDERERLSERRQSAGSLRDESFELAVGKAAEKRIQEVKEETLNSELEASKKRLEIAKQNRKRVEKIISRIEASMDERRKEREKAEERWRRYRKRRETLRGELREAEEMLQEARERYLGVRVRKEISERLRRRRKEASNVAEVASRGLLPRKVELFSELVTPDKEYRRLFEIVAGDKWHALVVDSWEEAKKVSDLAQKIDKDVSLIVLEDYSGSAVREDSLSRHLEVPEYLDDVATSLFAEVVIVDEVREAYDSVEEGFGAVHSDGEFFIEEGMLSQGELDVLPEDIPTGKIDKIRKALSDFDKMLDLRRGDLDDLEDDLERAREEIQEKTGVLKELEGAHEAFTQSNNSLARLEETLQDRVESLEEKAEREREALSRIEEDYSEITTKVSEAQGEAFEELRSQLLQGQDEVRDSLSTVRSQISHLETENDSIQETRERLEQSFERLLLQDEEEKRRLIRETDQLIQEERQEVDRNRVKARRAEEDLDRLASQLSSLRERLSSYKDAEKRQQEELRDVEEDIDETQRQLEELWQRRSRVRERKIRVESDIDSLRERLSSLGLEHPVDQAYVGAEELRARLQEEVEKIGQVNPLAKEKYLSKYQVYREFSQRRNELEREKNAILEFIEEVEKEKEDVFLEAFEKINRRFSEIIEMMDPEAEATLEIEDESDIFNSGVSIMVQFANKPMVEMTSLSGGEKSVVVLAFLLALQTVEEGAIYLFDELDAHLDPRNVEKFIKVLEKNAAKNQIVAVTLKPAVAEAADNLLGITMKRDKTKVIPMPRQMIREGGA